ncbi:class I SAM-dependent methyltransferase [Cerasicoccus frondis]|uniref:class I SAM-dependent methyltransferase n=1 Tax=Cerasicoccus frondis TaxID=490090 RepID=UPI00285289B8|nr:class I SAM-dependent methyltransferase [Cerasicoccus frondis]
MWDQRFSEPEFAYGKQANDFLREEFRRIPTGGRVLCLAEGQGRNAVFLAKQGYQVTALDLSPVGLTRAAELACENEVAIETLVADLAVHDLGEDWDGIICIFGHTPPPVRKRVHSQIANALTAGGVYILECYTPKQHAMPGRGGPPPEMKEFLMTLAELKEELAQLDLVISREVEREINEGAYHQGLSATVQVVSQKPA